LAKTAGEEQPLIAVREDYEHGPGPYVEVRKAGDRPAGVPGVLG
jgi:hypothetical protein